MEKFRNLFTERKIEENMLDNVLDKIARFGIKYSKYVAKMYTDYQGNFAGKLPVKITSAYIFEGNTLATDYLTGVYTTNGQVKGKFIGLSKSKFSKGDLISLYELEKFETLELPVYMIR